MAFSHFNPSPVNPILACCTAWLAVLCSLSLVLAGCCTYGQARQTICNDTTEVDRILRRVNSGCKADSPTTTVEHPRTIDEFERDGTHNYWEMSLDEALILALSNAQVLRDLGSTALQKRLADFAFHLRLPRTRE